MNGWYLLYFPFEGIGNLLRMLSLYSKAGNILALVLYVGLSLLPFGAGMFWIRKKQQRFGALEILFVILSAYTFYLLYAFINPYVFYQGMAEVGESAQLLPVLQTFFAGLWYVILISYIFLYVLRQLGEREILDQKEFLFRGLSCLILLTFVIYGLLAVGNAAAEALESVRALQNNAAATDMDKFFVVVRLLVSLLPQGFFLLILLRGRALIKVLEKDFYAPETVEAAKKLSETAVQAVRVSVLSSLGWNGGLFLFRSFLTSTNFTLNFTLMPLLLAFAALLLARYFREAGELHREHEMII